MNKDFKYLITPTLLNSYLYYKDSESENALADFKKVINKEFTSNIYCDAGNMWEDIVCNKQLETTDKLTTYIKDKIKNDDYQVVVKKNIVVNNINLLLYGKCDCVGYDIIRDIKTTSSDYEIGKYQNSMQHKIYLYCLDSIKQFEYLITKIKIKTESDKLISVEPIDNFAEFYTWQDSYESDIFNCIKDFFDFLELDKEIKEIYETKWKCKY